MATAQRTSVLVPQPPVERKVVTLFLSEEEASFLALLMARIGGCPRTSLRKYADNIRRSLDAIDMRYDKEAKKYSERDEYDGLAKVFGDTRIFCTADVVKEDN